MIGLLFERAVWAGLGALGFAFVFNVPARTLPGCALCGALGLLVRTVLVDLAFVDLTLATLAGASLVGVAAAGLARFYRAPAPIFAVCGVIPLVPGSFAFRAMLGLIRVASIPDQAAATAELYGATLNLVRAALVLVAIAFGIALPSFVFGRRRPVV